MNIIDDESLTKFSKLEYVNFLSSDSYLGILPGHAPMLSYVKKGKLDYKNEKNEINSIFLEKDGILEIKNNIISIFLI